MDDPLEVALAQRANVHAAFARYRSAMYTPCANGWAVFDPAESERLAECFSLMVSALASLSALSAEQAFNLIRTASEFSHAGQPFSATEMWRQPELFGSAEFRRALLEQISAAISTPKTSAENGSIDDRKASRKALRNNYIAECKRAGVRVTDEMIAQEANPRWSSRSNVRKWLDCDPKYDGRADEMIRSVFLRKPHLKGGKPQK